MVNVSSTDDLKSKAEQHFKEQEIQKSFLDSLISTVCDKTEIITGNSELNNNSFIEMNEVFKEIAAAVLAQSNSTQDIYGSVKWILAWKR
ncbi:hypothetical protein [Paenibacillus sp. UASWS1643]|uniref:hypothetical protein n=1 Tax=Paenibacillus sp. UASWS1643 TaxID=2580422 RepID=UPI00123A7BF1|nr:hypothetical protein [Paenibacillus sp. UASWS1643]KAA8745358.1 hypothetical protein FE296_26060 [Paenibacillus sp. UASWS1643]